MIRAGEAPAVERVEREQQVPVDHLYWVNELEAAEGMTNDVQAVCGVWGTTADWDGEKDDKSMAEAIIQADPEDCPACLKVLESKVLGRLMIG